MLLDIKKQGQGKGEIMKKLTLVSLIAACLACPAFAEGTGIGANAETADCDNTTLGTYEGPTTLQANWDANTIHINWYNDSEDNNGQLIDVAGTDAATCEYDKSIALPSNPSKTGYEFAGWRVRPAVVQSNEQQEEPSNEPSNEPVNG
jgi:hypothetical protein